MNAAIFFIKLVIELDVDCTEEKMEFAVKWCSLLTVFDHESLFSCEYIIPTAINYIPMNNCCYGKRFILLLNGRQRLSPDAAFAIKLSRQWLQRHVV